MVYHYNDKLNLQQPLCSIYGTAQKVPQWSRQERSGRPGGSFITITFVILPYRKRCWSLSGPCSKGQGVLVGKSFQNNLHMTDD